VHDGVGELVGMDLPWNDDQQGMAQLERDDSDEGRSRC
jgi:hypothetical protein